MTRNSGPQYKTTLTDPGKHGAPAAAWTATQLRSAPPRSAPLQPGSRSSRDPRPAPPRSTPPRSGSPSLGEGGHTGHAARARPFWRGEPPERCVDRGPERGPVPPLPLVAPRAGGGGERRGGPGAPALQRGAMRHLPYFCRGEVVKGFGRGSKELGIPTGERARRAQLPGAARAECPRAGPRRGVEGLRRVAEALRPARPWAGGGSAAGRCRAAGAEPRRAPAKRRCGRALTKLA